MTQTWTEAEQREHRKQWVEALRSGKYQQAQGQLRRDDGFCCLGVACEISGLGQFDGADGFTCYTGNSTGLRILPSRIREWLGLFDAEGDFENGSLASLNDGGKSFSFIADIIESEPKGLIAKVLIAKVSA